jgi:hypothetical protein
VVGILLLDELFERASGSDNGDNPTYTSWPVDLSDPGIQKAIRTISANVKGDEDLETALAAYRAIISMGTAFSAWNTRFKAFGIDQATATRIRYAGIEGGYVVPLIQGINLGYQFWQASQRHFERKDRTETCHS